MSLSALKGIPCIAHPRKVELLAMAPLIASEASLSLVDKALPSAKIATIDSLALTSEEDRSLYFHLVAEK